MNSYKCLFALLTCVFTVFSPPLAEAVLVPDGTNDAAYRALGTELAGQVLSLRVLVPGVGTGVRNTSATYLNSSYALTAAHNVFDLLQFNPTYEVATGDNFNTNRETVVGISEVLIFPGYVDGFPKNTPDLAILKLSEQLPGSAAKIGPTVEGDLLRSAGFGRVGTPSTGLNSPQDGFSRGWDSRVDEFFAIDVSDTYYFKTFFGSSSGLSLNGRGTSGDSGGPAYNSSGELVGIAVAVTPNFPSSVGGTYYLDLVQPGVASWIAANTIVPEPGTILSVILGLSLLTCRLRASR